MASLSVEHVILNVRGGSSQAMRDPRGELISNDQLQMPQAIQDPEGGHNSDGHHEQPQLPSNQSPQILDRDPKFRDSSGPLYTIYSEIAQEEDNKMAERWQKDMDGILIFTGFFSVTVAVLLVMSVQDLRQNPQVTSAFYLGNIYQILADSNGTVPRASIPSTLAILPPFSPPRYAVWVNSLWFLSFVASLTCGLWATLLRQWSHQYIAVTQPRGSPEKRARTRAFFANGVHKMYFPQMVETLPALLHLSLFLFFSGLVIFLFNVNHTVFTSVIWCIGLAWINYGWITLMPIFRHDSPYYAPFSSTVWSLYTSSRYILFKGLAFIAKRIGSYRLYFYSRDSWNRYRRWRSVDIRKEAEETAMKRSSKLDFHIFNWTMGALVNDDALEAYFRAIPGFANSKLTKLPKEAKPTDTNTDTAPATDAPTPSPASLLRLSGQTPDFSREAQGDFTHYERFWQASCGLLTRTLSINPAIEDVKSRRFANCINAMNAIPCPSHVSELIYRIIDGHLDQEPLSFEMESTLAPFFANNRPISIHAKSLACSTLMKMRGRGDRWIALAIDYFREFGVSEDQVRCHIARGHPDAATFLDILTTLADRLPYSATDSLNTNILTTFSKFNIHAIDISMQRRFCDLWNVIVKENDRKPRSDLREVLNSILHLYIALHSGTDTAPTTFASIPGDVPVSSSQWSYPLCDNPNHRDDPHFDPSLVAHIPSTSGGYQ